MAGHAVVVDSLPDVARSAVLTDFVPPSRLERGRLFHPQELKFEHVAIAVTGVDTPPVPGVEVDDRHRTRLPGYSHLRGSVRLQLRRRIVVLMSGSDRRRPHVSGDRLWVVKRHGPPAAMMAHLLIVDVIVLVPALRLGSRLPQVAVAVRVHDVSRPQDPGQRAVHGWCLEDALDLGNSRQDVVTGVALLLQDVVQSLADLEMKISRLIAGDQGVAAREEPAQGVVLKEMFCHINRLLSKRVAGFRISIRRPLFISETVKL